MSHIVEARTAILNPNRQLLSQAVNLVAQQHQGNVQLVYVDYYGRPQEVSTGLAIYTPILHRGIGVDVVESQLTFKGDPWGARDEFEQVQQEVIQMYVALASMQALQSLGYTTQAQDGDNREVVIQGVA